MNLYCPVHRQGEGTRIKREDSNTHTHIAENTNKFQYMENISRKLKKKKGCGGMDIRGQINWVINWMTDEELE
jgi:hypothetical protein